MSWWTGSRLVAVALGVGALAAVPACAARPGTPATDPSAARVAAIPGERGVATYYASRFDGRRTASGSIFDNDAMLAAHPTLAFGTVVRVTNLANGRSVQLTVVDRGPAAGPRATGVIIDVSQAAARSLDFVTAGRARVSVEVVRARRAGD